jgi:hypothetical protein
MVVVEFATVHALRVVCWSEHAIHSSRRSIIDVCVVGTVSTRGERVRVEV